MPAAIIEAGGGCDLLVGNLPRLHPEGGTAVEGWESGSERQKEERAIPRDFSKFPLQHKKQRLNKRLKMSLGWVDGCGRDCVTIG